MITMLLCQMPGVILISIKPSFGESIRSLNARRPHTFSEASATIWPVSSPPFALFTIASIPCKLELPTLGGAHSPMTL